MTIRKALLEQVDALERLLEIPRTAELREENQRLRKEILDLRQKVVE